MKKQSEMFYCVIILVVAAIVFPALLKKPRSSYPEHWKEEADEAVEWTKNFLNELTE